MNNWESGLWKLCAAGAARHCGLHSECLFSEEQPLVLAAVDLALVFVARRARGRARHTCSEAAMADGILRNAQVNAASTIRSLLQGLGFEQIELE